MNNWILFLGAIILISVLTSFKLQNRRPEGLPEGEWLLDYIHLPGKKQDSLYPDRKPSLNFRKGDSTLLVSGFTGCNRFNGRLVVSGNRMQFSSPMAMTKMFCPGEGETVFMETLKKVTGYSLSGNQLTLLSDDIAIMRFKRRT